jgi:hypothetical protein
LSSNIIDIIYYCVAHEAASTPARTQQVSALDHQIVGGWRDIVQEVVADVDAFPAIGIMERMGSRLAPMTIEAAPRTGIAATNAAIAVRAGQDAVEAAPNQSVFGR